MCNLYCMNTNHEAVLRLFNVSQSRTNEEMAALV
jgi:hypothetical protein